ncbi:2',5'-phosphodiesterase 12 [Habropoda laboriosa]|uniref:2',5'-phosphodiesterase 12 n=1 Tax=Habropoda laboriosa TaxID=597456 RepID=A0A0L7QRY0_9HYME|nr:2',5'-phosphodiesterase 12 [Habropoda laboriosa]
MSMLFCNLYSKCRTPFLPITKVYQAFYKNYSAAVVRLKMNEAIILHEESNNKFTMSFRYINPELNVDRQFNFDRQVDDSITKFIQRINTNINTYIMKKYWKKQKKKNKNTNEILEEKQVTNVEHNNVKFVRNQSILDGNLTCKSLLENSSDIKLVIFDTEYVLKQNIPYVTKIELPASILVDFPIYPSKFEAIHIDKTKCIFNWYKNDGLTWTHIGQGYLYVPNMSDLGCELKISCEPRNETQSGPMIELISKDIVLPGPGPCPFDTRHAFTSNKLSGKSFRVTSYNILANIYSATSLSKDTLYPYCPSYALSMDYRKLLLLKELMGYNTDIICLQEVDGKVYEHDLVPALSELNYDSIFNLKNELQEGLAIFYNQKRFDQLICDYSVISQDTNLNEFNNVLSLIQNDNVKKTFLNRNTIIQVAVLRSKENPEILIVGNTHLYFRPQADHIRLLQAYHGLLYLQTFANKMKTEVLVIINQLKIC